MRIHFLCLLLFTIAAAAQEPGSIAGSNAGISKLLPGDFADGGIRVASTAEHAGEMPTLPDAPLPRGREAFAIVERRETSPPAPALEGSERVVNKKFIISHAAFLGSIVYDAELTHQGLAHHQCIEANTYLGAHPGRGKLYGQNLLAFGAITGLDWITGKLEKIPYLPYITPVVETAVHIRGGSEWLTECW